ncbi:spherulation-specific family 4 protein [Streptomyces sp. RB6PN25]|uniref:Spherulation-specific family 4 protein n=1 Tax=Streptomyces humicola TaxID=2953240 RepID=A0ABT1PRE8_9ACTN|nr:spherulation-specific family 4 protein [Streptomyces humicola]MCQ4080241.1 spherulation-specific family 4 protein [Streptomyces humicola]
MPHLTIDVAGFGVPAHAHPLVAPSEWDALARPDAPVHWVVLNVDDGPGACPDPLYAKAVARLREARVRVLGHLDAAYGDRGFAELVSDARHYLDWYEVTGFYLDRAPQTRDRLPECRRAAATLEALLGRGDGHIVLGHGTHPYPGFAEIADQLVTYCGPWTGYRWSEAPEWTAGYPPERFCHLVHGVPRPHLEEAMRIARWQGAASVYFTDRTDGADDEYATYATDAARDAVGRGFDPWEGLPAYWDEAARILRDQPPPSR